MPRFVVLKHTKDGESHFDLMLEQGGVLLTLSFGDFPAPGADCERIFDHRPRYLDFEGDIGEGKGAVERVDAGEYKILSQTERIINARLSGDRLKGSFRLTMSGPDRWTLSQLDTSDAFFQE